MTAYMIQQRKEAIWRTLVLKAVTSPRAEEPLQELEGFATKAEDSIDNAETPVQEEMDRKLKDFAAKVENYIKKAETPAHKEMGRYIIHLQPKPYWIKLLFLSGAYGIVLVLMWLSDGWRSALSSSEMNGEQE